MPAKTKIRKVKSSHYWKISVFLAIFFFSLYQAESISIPKITINVQDSFAKDDTINFGYTISLIGSSREPLQLTYFASVICPNAPQGLIELKNAVLTSSNSITGTHSDFKISSGITPQACNASVTIMQPFSFSQYKSFDIITDPLLSIQLSTDKKVYSVNEEVIVKSTMDVFPDNVQSSLILPDGTKQDITLPYRFNPNQAGTYTAFVSASKQGYESSEDSYSFAVIEKPAEIRSASQCNANNVCDNNENSQNCPQDCVEKPAPSYNAGTQASTIASNNNQNNVQPNQNNEQQNSENYNQRSILSNSNFAAILIFAMIISGLLIGGVEVYRNKNKVDTLHELAKEHGVHVTHIYLEKVANYIKAAKGKGFSDERIREKLLGIGWKNWQIDEGFSRI